jgi:hypothetical protein
LMGEDLGGDLGTTNKLLQERKLGKVVGEIYSSHAAPAELALDPIVIRKAAAELLG